MVLWMVGLGLGDERDITLRGLDAVKACSKVYLEAYTSELFMCGVDRLEELYGRPVTRLDREAVEQGIDTVLEEAQSGDVAFLVVGDPFGATTHSDLQLRAKQRGVEVRVVHNATIMSAVGATGLQLYRFGECVSVVYFTPTWRPDSFYDKIKANRALGLHTLCLLDIRVKEPSVEALCRGKKEYEPPRYMSVAEAVDELLEVEDARGEGAYGRDTPCVAVCRVGTSGQLLRAADMGDLVGEDLGPPLHSLIICGEVHEFERECLEAFCGYPAARAAPEQAEA